MANRLVFIVEGDCEEYLVNQKIIPYLYLQVPAGVSWTMNVQKITTNRKLHARGGNVSYAYLEADIRRTSKQNGGNTYITGGFYSLALSAFETIFEVKLQVNEGVMRA